MIVDIYGVQVNVPDRWATHYTEIQKDRVRTWVAALKDRHGDWLVSVYIFRLVRRGDTGKKYRIDGGYCTENAASRALKEGTGG